MKLVLRHADDFLSHLDTERSARWSIDLAGTNLGYGSLRNLRFSTGLGLASYPDAP